MAHTPNPTPWKLEEREAGLVAGDFANGSFYRIISRHLYVAVTIGEVQDEGEDDKEKQLANARLIVRAVNAHQALVDALKLAKANLQFLPPEDVVEQIDAALALADKEQA